MIDLIWMLFYSLYYSVCFVDIDLFFYFVCCCLSLFFHLYCDWPKAIFEFGLKKKAVSFCTNFYEIMNFFCVFFNFLQNLFKIV